VWKSADELVWYFVCRDGHGHNWLYVSNRSAKYGLVRYRTYKLDGTVNVHTSVAPTLLCSTRREMHFMFAPRLDLVYDPDSHKDFFKNEACSL
jgi:hypothetical protein